MVVFECGLCLLGIGHSCFKDEITLFDENPIMDDFIVHEKYHSNGDYDFNDHIKGFPEESKTENILTYFSSPLIVEPMEIHPEEHSESTMRFYWELNTEHPSVYDTKECRYQRTVQGGCHRHCNYHCYCDDDIKCKKCLKATINFDTMAWLRNKDIRNVKGLTTNKLRKIIKNKTMQNVVNINGGYKKYYYFKDSFFDITSDDILKDYYAEIVATPRSQCEEASSTYFVQEVSRKQSSFKHVMVVDNKSNPYYDKEYKNDLEICLNSRRKQRKNYNTRCLIKANTLRCILPVSVF